MESTIPRHGLRLCRNTLCLFQTQHFRPPQALMQNQPLRLQQSICTRQVVPAMAKRRGGSHDGIILSLVVDSPVQRRSQGMRMSRQDQERKAVVLLEPCPSVRDRRTLRRGKFGAPTLPSNQTSDSCCTLTKFLRGSIEVNNDSLSNQPKLTTTQGEPAALEQEVHEGFPWKAIRPQGADSTAEPIIAFDELIVKDREIFRDKPARTSIHYHDSCSQSERPLEQQTRLAVENSNLPSRGFESSGAQSLAALGGAVSLLEQSNHRGCPQSLMTSDSSSKPVSESQPDSSPAQHRPLVVGLKKPSAQPAAMASSDAAAALNKEIQKNVDNNTDAAAPADEAPESSQPKQKKAKAPKQPKPPKAAPAAAPTSPALIDLRVGHILRAISHPNADSLYVSTIAMGDPEGTEHTQVDEETGKVVRTVCSGLNGLVPLAEMQDRKIIVVANLKPVNMRSIKSAAMVLAASPKQDEGADPHAPDRVVELVIPPEGSEAGDKVYFERWPYGEGMGPEKQLNPKKKQWEAIQPGFYTSDDLIVGFDAGNCDEVDGQDKGNLVVEGKGVCKVKTLKGATVR